MLPFLFVGFVWIRRVILNMNMHQKSPGRQVKTQIVGIDPRGVDSIGLRWCQRLCISNRFPGEDADDDGPGTSHSEPRGWKKEG